VWYVILVLSVVNVFNYMDRMVLSVLAPAIKTSLSLSDTQLGVLTGFAFAVFYAIAGIPLARWADNGVRRNVVAISLAAWSIVTALTGATQNFWQLFVARVGVGAGEAGGLAPAQSLICDYVPLERRAGIFAIHTLGLYVGMMVGMVLAGSLVEVVGWRWTFLVIGLPGVVLAAVVRITVREPRRGFFDAVKDDQTRVSVVGAMSTLWRCRTYRWLTIWGAALGFAQYGLTQWWPSYYVRAYGLSLSSVGVYLGVAIGAGSATGMLVGGLLANRAARKDVRGPLIFSAVGTALALPTTIASLFVSSASGSMVLVALTGAFWSVSNGPVTAAVYSVVTSRKRAMAGAINIFFTSVLGFGLGPLCVGVLSDLLAPSFGVSALRYALLAPTMSLAIVVAVLYAAANTLPCDLAAIGAQVNPESAVQCAAK
jgi:MFS family permease